VAETSADWQTQSHEFELDDATQDVIWAAEHVAFELEKRFGAAFLGHLKRGNIEKLSALLRPDFTAQLATGDAQKELHAGTNETTARATEKDASPISADDFAAASLELTTAFKEFHTSRFRALNVERRETDGAWATRIPMHLVGRLHDRDGRPGPLSEVQQLQRVVFLYGEDKELEDSPVVSEWVVESTTWRNRENRMLEEATQTVGLDQIPLDDNWTLPVDQSRNYRFQLAVDDFDRDGWLDLAIAEYDRSRVFRWSPEKMAFEDVSVDRGIRVDRSSVTSPTHLVGWIDFDNDGFPDLLMGDRLYQNRRGQFVDVTARSGLSFEPEEMGVHVADFDADGRLDLYFLYHGTPKPRDKPAPWIDDTGGGAPNALWRNLGDGRFEDVTLASGAGGGDNMTLAGAWLRLDDDPFPDLYLANDFAQNVMLRNLGNGTFEDVSEPSGTTDFSTTMGVAVGDVENNGTTDLYAANMYSKMGRRIIAHVCEDDYSEGIYQQIKGSCAGNRLYRRRPGSDRFTDSGEDLGIHDIGWAYAPAMLDIDNDGWLDLYASTGFFSRDRGKPDG